MKDNIFLRNARVIEIYRYYIIRFLFKNQTQKMRDKKVISQATYNYICQNLDDYLHD